MSFLRGWCKKNLQPFPKSFFFFFSKGERCRITSGVLWSPLLHSLCPPSLCNFIFMSLLEDKAWLAENLDLPVVSTLSGWDYWTFFPAPLPSTLWSPLKELHFKEQMKRCFLFNSNQQVFIQHLLFTSCELGIILIDYIISLIPYIHVLKILQHFFPNCRMKFKKTNTHTHKKTTTTLCNLAPSHLQDFFSGHLATPTVHDALPSLICLRTLAPALSSWKSSLLILSVFLERPSLATQSKKPASLMLNHYLIACLSLCFSVCLIS